MTTSAPIGSRSTVSRGRDRRITRFASVTLGVCTAVLLLLGCTRDTPAAGPVQPFVPDGFEVLDTTEATGAPGVGGTTASVTMRAPGTLEEVTTALDAAARDAGFEQEARVDDPARTVMAYRRDGDVTLTFTVSPDGDGPWTAVAVLVEP